MARRRRSFELFSTSMLDCICCGLGALILLLALSKIAHPVSIEKSEADLQELVTVRDEKLSRIRSDTDRLARELSMAGGLASDARLTLGKLQRELTAVTGQHRLRIEDLSALTIDEGELRAALQQLTADIERLQANFQRTAGDAIGGIPVDGEYIIFVIDTSGSMQSKWPFVEQKLGEVLDVYPTVKGLQVMNDNGRFMFPQYGRTWLNDTPQLRQLIKDTMPTWGPHSDSDPSDGITYAIETFWSSDKGISIYVFGDEFEGESMDAVVREIDEINAEDENGDRRVRIHAIGFPHWFGGSRVPDSSRRFTALMRVICRKNGGTFVGLTGGS